MSNKDVVTSEYSLLFGDCLERMKETPDASVVLRDNVSHKKPNSD